MTRDFAEALAIEIENAGITAYRLSQLSGVSNPMISNLLARRTKPGWETVVKIAKALAIPLERFVSTDIIIPEPSEPRGRGRPEKGVVPDEVIEEAPKPKKPRGKKGK